MLVYEINMLLIRLYFYRLIELFSCLYNESVLKYSDA